MLLFLLYSLLAAVFATERAIAPPSGTEPFVCYRFTTSGTPNLVDELNIAQGSVRLSLYFETNPGLVSAGGGLNDLDGENITSHTSLVNSRAPVPAGGWHEYQLGRSGPRVLYVASSSASTVYYVIVERQ